ncbi:MAG: DNA photolyase [Bacteroidota bacterium]
MTALDILRQRTRRLSGHPVAKGADYVLCWVQQSLRAEVNPLIDVALALGNTLGLPVVVLHTLENRYPYASHRIHRFMLEASQDLGPGVEARGLRFARYVRPGPAGGDAAGTVEIAARVAQRAAAVFVDDVPTFVTPEYASGLVEALDRPVFAVDACCAVPMNAIRRHIRTTKAFRAAHTPLRSTYVETVTRQQPDAERFDGDLDLPETPDLDDFDSDALDDFIRQCGVDLTVPPAEGWSGRRSAALDQLATAVEDVVGRYKWTRNNPAITPGSARISPWMHFGVLSPLEVARAVLDGEADGHIHRDARWKFLDEMLTWREVYHHRCRHEPDWARFDGLPTWVQATLQEHADDPRRLYPLDQLAHGETGDETWNAAQKAFTLDGWMNNNLRMYWVKQILRWRPSPADAFATACYLNDRFSLDGRDASTYGGIRWGFGEAKRGYRDVPIYGWVPPRSDSSLRKRTGVSAWLAEQATREIPVRAEVPSDPPPEFDRYR